MEYTIRNESLSVTISDFGAELQSIQSAAGTEYLWQGDPAFWRDRAPNIFPYVGRTTEGRYTADGTPYRMQIHGIAKYRTFQAIEQGMDRIEFRLDSDDGTRAEYPYDFTYRIVYELRGNVLVTTNIVENTGDRRMYFGLGGHPGIRVPMEPGLAFEDYYLEFDQPAHPYRVGLSDSCLVSGHDDLYRLEDDRRLPLRHDLFDRDAVVLRHAARAVRIASDRGERSVTVSYPDFQYIGFWHKQNAAAPYVCVEPWTSLPSREGVVEELSLQADLIRLDAGEQYKNCWTMKFI